MSKWYVITDMGYKETTDPPNHDHWSYDYKEDAYYEHAPNYVIKCNELGIPIERHSNDI